MSVHEQFAEDLSLYALGSLEGAEREALEKHLESCASCQQELRQLHDDMAMLALSASGPAPPRRSRERLLAAIAKEPRLQAVPKRRISWAPVGWLAAAAAVIVAAVLWQQNADLRQRVGTLEVRSSQQSAELERVKTDYEVFSSPETLQITLVSTGTPQPQGRAFYLQSRGRLVFLANNMPALPADRVYELWLIPPDGKPLPAGVFQLDAHGNGKVVNPPLQPGVQPKLFAVTVEPRGGSAAPTTKPMMIGTAI
jgi:anti-sigma-K factor RskA